MKKLLPILIIFLSSLAWANQRFTGKCTASGSVLLSGLSSTNTADLTYANAIVTVSVVGGGLATLFLDNMGTPLSNPFTASSDASLEFYAANGRYSVVCSGVGVPTTTINADALLVDPQVSSTTTNFSMPEGSCALALSGFDVLCANSSLHTFESSLNGGSFLSVPQLTGDLGNTAASPQVQSTHINGVTNNMLMKASSTGNMVNSSITDNGTTISTSENITTTKSGNIGGPNPWFDVSTNVGVDCTGATDSSTAINSIITSASALPGAVIYFPEPSNCQVKMDHLSLSGLSNLTFRGANGGFYGAHGSYNLVLSGTGPTLLNLQNASSIHFYDMAINMPNATSGPLVDLTGGGANGFHHILWHGPGTTVGPMFQDVSTNYITWDNWTSIQNVSVAVNGATNATPCCSDLSIFDRVTFSSIGTSVMQNASVNWTISNSGWNNGGTACVPFLQYTVAGALPSNFNWYNSSITGEPGCSNNVALFSAPATAATNATGGLSFHGGLILGNLLGTGNMTLFSLGANQSISIHGMNFCLNNPSTVFSLGAGTTVDMAGNAWDSTSASCASGAQITFYAGGTFLPTSGSVTDNTGKMIDYSHLTRKFAVDTFGVLALDGNPFIRARTNGVYCWDNSGGEPDAGSCNPGSSRIQNGVIAFGNGNQNDSSAQILADGNRVELTADWTCGTGGTVSSCTSATIIGSGGGVPLTFTLPTIAKSYDMDCAGVVGQATAATANQWNLLTATNGANNVTATYDMGTAATASAFGAVTDQGSTTTTFQIAPSWTLGGTGTKMPFHIHASIQGASASGTVLSLQLLAPTVGDLVTIYRGAGCHIY